MVMSEAGLAEETIKVLIEAIKSVDKVLRSAPISPLSNGEKLLVLVGAVLPMVNSMEDAERASFLFREALTSALSYEIRLH